MAVWSGVGGHAKTGIAGASVNWVSEWEIEKTMRLAESTRSSSTGVERANILPDGTFSISLPWDDSKIPEEQGFREGAEIILRLLIGNSGKSYFFTAKCEKVKVIENVPQDIVRCVVSGYSQNGIGDPIPNA